jgi:hypothetical protein
MSNILNAMYLNADIDREVRQRILRVPRELLRAALYLPENVTIVAVSDSRFFDSNDIALKIECPDFKPQKATNVIPPIDVRLKTISHKEIVFDGWWE